MADINTLLTDSLIYVGAYAQGQTANSDDLSLAMRVVNRKLDSMSAEKLSMIGILREQYPFTGAASYTYGPGMTWGPLNRPVKIKSASTLSTLGTEHPARLPTADEWARVDDKTRTGVYAEDLFYDNGFPTGHVYVSPMPGAGNCILWTYQNIPQLPGVSGTINLAPGYEAVIVAVAARELCVAFQRPLTQELNNAAEQARQVIIQLNAELFNAPAAPPAGPGPTSPPAVQTT
jgi:hypothetical protein